MMRTFKFTSTFFVEMALCLLSVQMLWSNEQNRLVWRAEWFATLILLLHSDTSVHRWMERGQFGICVTKPTAKMIINAIVCQSSHPLINAFEYYQHNNNRFLNPCFQTKKQDRGLDEATWLSNVIKDHVWSNIKHISFLEFVKKLTLKYIF